MVGQNDRSAAEAAVQPQGQEAAVTCAAQEATTGGTSMHQSVGAGESLRAQQDEETGVASSRGTETGPDDLNVVKSLNRGDNEDDSSDDKSSVQVPDNADVTETSPDDLNAVKSVNRGGNEDDSSDDNSSVQVPDNADDDV
eukprot:CAMPEP_0178478732 /NCGR_PEP_ID=MMETSP0696-20121128/4814_1 /TAXON_ID=265572 /ORGANISM="Extubocellulus spinifer, Strain CCMP396" /LENGTH=140 /DNA_ID=CAMNT_0020106115 /DNA_START=260 /DNA_END=678 /DNA_ORIENTATION=-